MTMPTKEEKREVIQETNGITYEQLKIYIDGMSPEQLKRKVVIYNKNLDEFEPITDIKFTSETGILDENHPFLEFEG